MITPDDPRHEAAQAVLNAMHEFWKLQPMRGAVQWIEDADGRVVIFTRGEYRDHIMAAIDENIQEVEMFETDHRFVCDTCGHRCHMTDLEHAIVCFSNGSSDNIQVCPSCKDVESSLKVVCDEPGCWQRVECGWPSSSGYRSTCSKHRREQAEREKSK